MRFSSRCMKRVGVMVCGFLIVGFCGSILMAKPGVVKTRDGRSIEGDVNDQGDTVTITVHGIPTNIPKENVESIQYTGSIEEQYQQKLSELPKNAGASDHLDLARWLLNNRAYDLALREVSAAQHLDPNNSDAATLEQTIESQMRLDRAAHKAPPTTPPPAVAAPAPAAPPAAAGGSRYNASMHRYLNTDQIYSLRLAEWPADDTSVKISFTNDVRQKYIAAADENAAQFMRLSPVDQANAILGKGSPNLRKDIKLLTDPAPLATYKRNIQPIILSGCATAACHGGPAGGKFFLYGNPNSEAATYTNFYLLMKGSAETGGVTSLMVDRDYPDESLLAKWGLPADISKPLSAHPEVKGVAWRPIFRNMRDPQYRALISWIGSLVKPAPHYDFTFSLNTPATTPAGRAR